MKSIKIEFGSPNAVWQNIANLAILSHNTIARYKKYNWSTEYEKGQRYAFLLVARSLKGWQTQAKAVNSLKRVKAVA